MPKQTRRPSPFADYIEWTQHRYDPGYYLGGNLPPHLRKGSLGRRARRLSGALLGFSAVMGAAWALAAAVASNGSRWDALGFGVTAALFGAAAFSMFRSGKPRS